jgi:sugar phosphate isomerase/epimerase
MLLADPPPSARLSAATYRRRRAVALAAIALVGVVPFVVFAALGSSTVAARALAPARGPVTIAWVGDITPGSALGVPPGDGSVQFAAVRRRLRAADLSFGNLEGTYSVGGTSKCGTAPRSGCYAFQAPPDHAPALRRAGFDAVNLANNHAYDYGAAGRAQTLAALRRARIAATGGPDELAILRRNGVRIALLGFAAYPWASSLTDLAGVRALVRRAARRADVVVVAMHAGAEGADQTHVPQGAERAFGEDRGDSRAFAHTAVDAGADLVVGSGPHVIRGVERYHSRLIAYSLGNFAGWNNFGLGGPLSESGILRVKLTAEGAPTSVHWVPIHLTGPGIPKIEHDGTSKALVKQLSKQDFGRATGIIPSSSD